MAQAIEKSEGHLGLLVWPDGETKEIVQVGEEFGLAPISRPIMTDGRRCCRFEGPMHGFEVWVQIMGSHGATVDLEVTE